GDGEGVALATVILRRAAGAPATVILRRAAGGGEPKDLPRTARMPPARPLSTPVARIASGVFSHTDISAASPLLNNYRGWEADGTGAGRISGRTHAMVIDVQIFNEESMAIAQA